MAHLYPSLLFPIVILGLVFYSIPWLSGWRSLAERYLSDEKFSGPTRTFWYAHLRSMTKYNRALKVGCDGRGLSLSTAFYFRLGHPPLFIPWTDLNFVRREEKIFFYRWPVIRIFFKECPGIYLDLAEKVLAETELAMYAVEIDPGEAPEIQKGKEILRMALFMFLIFGAMVLFFFFLIPYKL